MRPRQVFDLSSGIRVFSANGNEVTIRGAILNVTGERFAYNFGNPLARRP